jgi:two-component system, NarL family, nitrate/nitrite sensor histidine kinase NarX
MRQRPWTLSSKLALLCAGFLLAALTSIGLTLWITWQIEGGAAAVNEAGRLRMKLPARPGRRASGGPCGHRGPAAAF